MTTEVRKGSGRFPVGLTVATAIAFAILIGLGTWQVQRLHWKEGLLANIAALQAAPAQRIGPVLERAAAGRDADFTRVSVSCQGLGSAPFLEQYALREGQAGVRLISACAVDAGPYHSVLVDRGFVPDSISARPPASGGAGPALTVTGILRKPDRPSLFAPANTPGRWYRRDVAAMAAALHAPAPAPLFLMAETSTNPEWTALVPAPIPAEIPNNHLEYALTWYGLAVALLGVYAAMLFRRRTS